MKPLRILATLALLLAAPFAALLVGRIMFLGLCLWSLLLGLPYVAPAAGMMSAQAAAASVFGLAIAAALVAGVALLWDDKR